MPHPETTEERWGPMGRMEAASALAYASGHTLDDCVLIVAALENSDIHFVKTPPTAGIEVWDHGVKI